MERTATAAQVKEQFVFDGDLIEALQSIRETLEENWSIKEATEFILSAFENLEKQAKIEGEDLKTWGFLDKITWVVKEAYNMGFLQGYETTMEANRMAYDALFGEEAI